MTGNVADPTAAPPTPSPTIHAQGAELRELESQFPAPILSEVLADWEWLYGEWNRGNLYHLADGFIAVRRGEVVGSDPDDELALRLRLAVAQQTHPERFVISYFGEFTRPDS